jgi:hypothetical protein
MGRIHWEFSLFCSALFRRAGHDEAGDVRQVPITACQNAHENSQKPVPPSVAAVCKRGW